MSSNQYRSIKETLSTNLNLTADVNKTLGKKKEKKNQKKNPTITKQKDMYKVEDLNLKCIV